MFEWAMGRLAVVTLCAEHELKVLQYGIHSWRKDLELEEQASGMWPVERERCSDLMGIDETSRPVDGWSVAPGEVTSKKLELGYWTTWPSWSEMANDGIRVGSRRFSKFQVKDGIRQVQGPTKSRDEVLCSGRLRTGWKKEFNQRGEVNTESLRYCGSQRM
jgi:hypothetical protein